MSKSKVVMAALDKIDDTLERLDQYIVLVNCIGRVDAYGPFGANDALQWKNDFLSKFPTIEVKIIRLREPFSFEKEGE